MRGWRVAGQAAPPLAQARKVNEWRLVAGDRRPGRVILCKSESAVACERIDPGDFPGEPISLDHYGRYLFAGQFAHGKRVLDAACGLGYGASYLRSAGARDVLGVDVDPEAIRSARETYGTEGLLFATADVHELSDHIPGAWDVITSFETIEHVADPERFIRECRNVMAPEGILVASVPNVANDPPGDNPFHIHQFDRAAFEHLLARSFAFVEIMPQSFVVASHIDAGNGSAVGMLFHQTAEAATSVPPSHEPDCFIAICAQANPRLSARSAIVHARKLWDYFRAQEEGKAWLQRELSAWENKANKVAADYEQQAAYLNQLESGKAWLEAERSKWEQEATTLAAASEQQRNYIAELEQGKSWLEQERHKWEQRATELSALIERQSVQVPEMENSKD